MAESSTIGKLSITKILEIIGNDIPKCHFDMSWLAQLPKIWYETFNLKGLGKCELKGKEKRKNEEEKQTPRYSSVSESN